MFWENFVNLCEKNNTKPNPVASHLGISSGAVTKWKKEGAIPNGATLNKIAEFFNVSVDYLLGRTDKTKTELTSDSESKYEKMAAENAYLKNIVKNLRNVDDPSISIMGDKGQNMFVAVNNKEEYEFLKAVLKTLRDSRGDNEE